jgi:tetraacyldisaccharide 4'-kinase
MVKKLIYVPLSGLYALGLAIRHFLYDKHLLISHAAEVPTICVGNLAVGGTGKTPAVEYIVRLLLRHGYHPAVLSRGYKRRSHGFVLADSSASVAAIGDEAMQLHRAFPDVPVAVCEQRVKGVKQLKRQIKKLDVVILDDALQHRAIRCGYSVLLTPYDRLYIDDHLLPWGRLRDLRSRSLKADAVIVSKCPENIKPIDMRVVENRLHLPTYQSLHFSCIEYDPITQEGNPLVLCGIAQPQYLIDHVKTLYPHAELMAYEDHHAFSRQEVKEILLRARHFDFVLTTEKDMQRLRDTTLEEQLREEGKPLVTLPVRMRFVSPQEAFDRHILTYVGENCRTRKQ